MASIAAVWSCHFFFLKFLFFSFSHVVIIILLKKLSLTTYSYMPKNISVLIYGAIKNAILRLKKVHTRSAILDIGFQLTA